VKYSLIAARQKQLLDSDTKLWVAFFLLIILLFGAIKIALILLIATQEVGIASLRNARIQYEAQIEEVERKAQLTVQDIEIAPRAIAKNKVIKDSLTNLLNLVPDQIYITELEASASTLKIKGYTPSKEVYNYLLKPPLESIFAKTAISFIPTGKGGFAFDSLSVMDEQERLFYDK
jgi:Tfp pilus assembly protein PilN